MKTFGIMLLVLGVIVVLVECVTFFAQVITGKKNIYRELTTFETKLVDMSHKLNKFYEKNGILRSTPELGTSIECDEHFENVFREKVFSKGIDASEAVRHYGATLLTIVKNYKNYYSKYVLGNSKLADTEIVLIAKEFDSYYKEVFEIVKFALSDADLHENCKEILKSLDVYKDNLNYGFDSSVNYSRAAGLSISLLKKVAEGNLDAITGEEIKLGTILFLDCDLALCFDNAYSKGDNLFLGAFAFDGKNLETVTCIGDFYTYNVKGITADYSCGISGGIEDAKKAVAKSKMDSIKNYFIC